MTLLRFTTLDQLNHQDLEVLNKSDLGQIINQHFLFNPISQCYYQEYIGPHLTAKSLIVFDNDRPVLMMPMLSDVNTYNYAGSPSEIFSLLDQDSLHSAITFLAQKLKKSAPGKALTFKDNSTLFSALFSQSHTIKFDHQGSIDLTLSEDLIYKNVRKSYRPFVNWGRKELHVNIIDENNPDENKFNSFKNLHVTVSGRQTRNDATWQAQMNMIKAGFGYLITANISDELVSGCFVMHDKATALYAVAASDRKLMDANLPLNHFPLYSAIIEAKRKGCRLFKIGEIDNVTDTKAANIARFKRGFITDIVTDRIITVQL